MEPRIKFSPQAKKRDAENPATSIPLDRIFENTDFNCRGKIKPVTCIGLAKDIAENGLSQPIMVREIDHPDYDYEIVLGHRRWNAYKLTDATHIPCVIRNDMTEIERETVNATENLNREDIGFYEEIQIVEKFRNRFMSFDKVAELLNKSDSWVRVRDKAAKLPKLVMDIVKAGYIKPSDINDLSNLEQEQLYQVAVQLRDRRRKGESTLVKRLLHKRQPKDLRKKRSPHEIERMMTHIRSATKKRFPNRSITLGDIISVQGNSIITVFGGWAAGNNSNEEFFDALQSFCDLAKINYTRPDYIEA